MDRPITRSKGPHWRIKYDLSRTDAKERVQAFLDAFKPIDDDEYETTFDLALMRHQLRLLSLTVNSVSSLPIVSFALTVSRDLCSRFDVLHGGAAALIIDMCTTASQAAVAKPGFWEFGGVSRTLSATYLRPIPLGTEVLVICEIMQVGKLLLTMEAKIFRRQDMVLLCTGEHNKVTVELSSRSRI